MTAILSARQLQCVYYSAEGRTNIETAKLLKVSEATVKTHLRRAYHILGAVGLAQAVHLCYQQGLFELRPPGKRPPIALIVQEASFYHNTHEND